ncbi:SDR family NAD(P)-dependent oxidoreductase [Kibdelosporangium philippinense]
MALLDELTNDGTRHIDLVHCWPHHSPDTSAELEVVRAHAEQAVSRVLTTLRASTGRSGSLRLHLVTVRTQQTDTESVDPLGAVWWGLGRTARIERPDLAVRLVDLGDPADAVELDALATQILAPGHEPDVALRADRRFGPRLVPSPAAGSDDVPRVDGSGCHLVTGGLSGLGLTAAEWLVSRGARHLVLVGRSEPTAEIARRLSTLTARGVRVDVIAADVADPIAMRDLFARFGQGGPRLRGVIHSAGVLRDQLLTDQHWQHFDDVFRTKVYGALLLHEHTRDLDLDFFLLFSSAAAVLGSAGQASYAAGNAFLDALAHHRAALRLPATTVNWGRWADSGMAARLDERDRGRWEARGVAAISPQDGVRALGRVFTSGTPQAVVVSVDWDAYRTAHAKPHLPLLADLDQSVADPRPATPHPRELPAPHDERSLVDLIRAELADVLGYDPAAVRPDSRFDELDIDSLASMELLHRLTAVTGVQLAADTIFEQRDSRALAAYLQGALSGAEPGPQPTVDIAAMFWTGVDSGRFAESHALMHAVAALRPVSDRAELSVVPLNSGSGAHVLLFPPMVALSDPHLYKHLAAAFGDDLAVSALTLPGFLEHEPLVSSRGVLMRLYSEAVIAHVGDSPFVLAGHSSGGTLAYELAQLLQHDAGRSPDGVVLLDAHVATSQVLLDHAKEFYDSIRDRQSTADRLSVARLSAQAWYLEMFREWATLALSCPSLLLRAAQPLRPGAATERSVAPITASDTADVPGDHFTMIEKHASTTARVAREWLDRLLPGNRLN